MRKHVLRKAAEIIGVPESIVKTPKKAAQYSSGSDRALRQVAKRHKKNPRDYVCQIFNEVFENIPPMLPHRHPESFLVLVNLMPEEFSQD